MWSITDFISTVTTWQCNGLMRPVVPPPIRYRAHRIHGETSESSAATTTTAQTVSCAVAFVYGVNPLASIPSPSLRPLLPAWKRTILEMPAPVCGYAACSQAVQTTSSQVQGTSVPTVNDRNAGPTHGTPAGVGNYLVYGGCPRTYPMMPMRMVFF